MAEHAPEFLTFAQAAKRLGIAEMSLRRRCWRGEFTLWQDPADHRRRLIRADDVDRYLVPRPLPRRREEVPVPA